MKKTRPVVKIHGGKYYLSDFVISHFPFDYGSLDYFELFGGAASVLTNKKRSGREVYNEIDPGLCNIFRQLAVNPAELVSTVRGLEYDERVFERYKNTPVGVGSLEAAVAELVVRRMSRGGMKKHFSWSTRLRGGRPGDLNAWETFKDLLPVLAARLSGVEVLCQDALALLPDLTGNADSLVYLDPPYVFRTRTAKKVYDNEMTDDQHVRMGELVNQARGKVVISGYDSDLYRQLYRGWRWAYREMPNNAGQGKTKGRRTECLIMNY